METITGIVILMEIIMAIMPGINHQQISRKHLLLREDLRQHLQPVSQGVHPHHKVHHLHPLPDQVHRVPATVGAEAEVEVVEEDDVNQLHFLYI